MKQYPHTIDITFEENSKKELSQEILSSAFTSKRFFLRYFFGILAILLSCFSLSLAAVAKQSILEIENVKSEFYEEGSTLKRIRDVELLTNGSLHHVDIQLAIKSKIVMSNEQSQMLLNGIPLTFVYDIRIEEKGQYGFWRGNNYEKEIHFLLFYHGLSKQFVVRDLNTQKQHSYPILSLALLSISNLNDIEFNIVDEAGFRLNRYHGKAKLWLDIEALPTPLRIPAYLSSNWWLNSSWFKWELKL